MSVKKNLEEVKKYIDLVSRVCIKQSSDFLSAYKNTDSDAIQLENLSKVIIQKIKYSQEQIWELYTEAEKNTKYSSVNTLRDSIVRQYNDEISKLTLFGKIFKKYEPKSPEYKLSFQSLASNLQAVTISLNKISNVMLSDLAILEQTQQGFVSSKFTLFGKSKFSKTIKLENKKVTINIFFRINMKEDKIKGMPINNFIEETISNSLNFPHLGEKYEKHLYKIKYSDRKTIEKDILAILFNTLQEILERHSYFIRSSSTNLYLSFISDDSKAAGNFLNLKSTFRNIFVQLTPMEDIFLDYINMERTLRGNGKSYETLVHELTHAYDWMLNKDLGDRSKEEYAKILLGKNQEPCMQDLAFIKIISDCRLEGLARISGRLEKYLNSPHDFKAINVLLFFKNYNFSLEHVKNLLESLLSSKENNCVKMISDSYEEGAFHDFGMAMAMIIYISENQKRLFLAIHTDPEFERFMNNMPFFVQPEFKDYCSKHGIILCKPGNINKFMNDIISGRQFVHIISPEIYLKEDLRNFIHKISLMNPVQFMDKYEKACDDLSISDKILTRKAFNEIHKNYAKIIKEIS